MKTHIFIVNDETFPIHLRYMFAGTGAKDEDFNASLLCDIKRVRPGDFVIFYIEGTTKMKGGFYGIFRAKDNTPFVLHTKGKNGYYPNLNKKLIFRILIEPYEVYPEGVEEWEALDKLPLCSTEILWSLIYRKLKGKRGCSPLLPWEADRLINMIRHKNRGNAIATSSYKGGLDWDKNRRVIVLTNLSFSILNETLFSPLPDTLQEICKLHKKNRSYEIYLQLYFMENIQISKKLRPIVGSKIFWFGNEIPCGVGMQKIDILTISQDQFRKEYRIIELKDEPVTPEIVTQIEYYVNWASQNNGKHLKGATTQNIRPVIVAPSHRKKDHLQQVLQSFKNYQSKGISLPILYFEYLLDCRDQQIEFIRRKY